MFFVCAFYFCFVYILCFVRTVKALHFCLLPIFSHPPVPKVHFARQQLAPTSRKCSFLSPWPSGESCCAGFSRWWAVSRHYFPLFILCFVKLSVLQKFDACLNSMLPALNEERRIQSSKNNRTLLNDFGWASHGQSYMYLMNLDEKINGNRLLKCLEAAEGPEFRMSLSWATMIRGRIIGLMSLIHNVRAFPYHFWHIGTCYLHKLGII